MTIHLNLRSGVLISIWVHQAYLIYKHTYFQMYMLLDHTQARFKSLQLFYIQHWWNCCRTSDVLSRCHPSTRSCFDPLHGTLLGWGFMVPIVPSHFLFIGFMSSLGTVNSMTLILFILVCQSTIPGLGLLGTTSAQYE